VQFRFCLIVHVRVLFNRYYFEQDDKLRNSCVCVCARAFLSNYSP